jgi:hypothetical protein
MKKRFLMSAVCAAAISLCAVAPMNAQGGDGVARRVAPGGPAPIPQLPFHLMENFFHYPANYILGRVSGIAVAPTGNIVALNRGYHPVLEFKADGTFVHSWGEGSGMFVGAHQVRFDPQGNLWYVDAADDIIYRFDSEGRTVGTLGTNPEPWTWLTHVIERRSRQGRLLSGDGHRLEQGWQHVRRRRIRQFAGCQVRQGRQLRQGMG